ncbi:MAG: S9 family peptidase, partial [Candidatus Promineifilaceae bacterium]
MNVVRNPDGQVIDEKYERQGWPAVKRPDLKPPKGWSLSLLTAVNRVRNHRLSPNGEQIAFIWDREGQSDVYLMPSSGGWPSRISLERAAVTYWTDERPTWSPDGRWLAFTMDDHIHVASVASGLVEKISDFAVEASDPIWMPDSNRLVISIVRDEKVQIVMTDRDGSWPHGIVDAPGDVWNVKPSPDGRFLLFTHRPLDDLNRLDIWLVEVETGQIRELTNTPQRRNWGAIWSPDGSLIAFISEVSGFNEVWLVQPDGSNLRQLSQLGMDAADLEWSPDGTRIACTVNRQGAVDLALMSVDSGEVRYLKTGKGYYAWPQWSPDCAFLTVEYEDAQIPADLYRVEVANGRTTQLTFSQLPILAANGLVVPEIVSYKSYDGLEIPAFLYRPKKSNGAAVLYPHGGPSGQYVYGWDLQAQYFVAKGYTWLAPNYRGSTGYGLEFEHANYNDWGIGDTQDCLYGARFLRGLPEIDPERLAIYGGSYGGYMTVCCLSRDPDYLFACGVDKYGDSNIITSWAQCNRDLRLYTEIFLNHPAKNRAVHVAASPIAEIKNVQKPVLIVHGLDDTIVPPQAAEEWVEALRREGKTFEYKTYAGEAHGFLKKSTILDFAGRMERFLDWYLLP